MRGRVHRGGNGCVPVAPDAEDGLRCVLYIIVGMAVALSVAATAQADPTPTPTPRLRCATYTPVPVTPVNKLRGVVLRGVRVR